MDGGASRRCICREGPNGLTPENEFGGELGESEGNPRTYFALPQGHFLPGIDSFLFTSEGKCTLASWNILDIQTQLLSPDFPLL